MILTEILFDALGGAMAAIGFGAISDPPKRAFLYIALLGALGHAGRYFLMHVLEMDIATSSFVAAITIGFSSLLMASIIRTPATVIYIPALLPMIPGKYAYNTVFAQLMFLKNMNIPELKAKYMEMFFSNGTITLTVIFLLAMGATLPMFVFSSKAYSMTRKRIKTKEQR